MFLGVSLVYKDVRYWVLAIVSGLLMALSSAPFDLWYLAYVAYVPLFIITQDVKPSKQGLAFALACTVIAANWWHSTIIYSSFFFILILAALAFSFYLWAVLSSRFRTSSVNPLLAIFMPAVIWIGLERILSSEWVGIPCNIGITQANQPLLIQSANFFGIYTTSFLIIVSNTAIAMLLLLLKKYFDTHNKNKTNLNNSASSDNQPNRNQVINKFHIISVLLVFIIMGLNLGYGYYQLQQSETPVNPVNVVIIQPVISSNLYVNSWRNPESRGYIRNVLSDLTKEGLKKKPDLLVWPEGGNGYLNMRVDKLRNELYTIAKEHNTDLLISSNDLDEEGKKYNSVFSISREGKLLDRYDKVMLIPGSEDSYTAGSEFTTIKSSYGTLGPVICYESNFPSPLRKVTANGAELLFVSTSDAPFKKTSLTINHTRTAIFRAIENNRWVIHASNTGPSVIVSPLGNVKASVKFYQRGVVSGEVGYIKAKSFFTLYGYLVPILFSVVVFVLLFILIRQWLNIIKGRKVKYNQLYTYADINLREVMSSRLAKIYLGFSVLHVMLLTLLMLSSIVIVYRMAPDTPAATVTEVVEEFFKPLDELAPDTVGEKFLQGSSNTCGPAVLAYVFSYFGHEVSESQLVQSMTIGKKGSSMLELKRTVLENGFQAKGVKENYAALMKESLPVIAYINDSHYVVVNKITTSAVYLFDPLLGHVQVSRRVFESGWKGYILLINMKKIKPEI